MDHCPDHDCPLVQAGDAIVCLFEQAESLVGGEITDLIMDGGQTVLIFDNRGLLPMHGWSGNVRAAGDEESADALLDVLEGNYLLAVEADEGCVTLHIADHPGGIEDCQWILTLAW